MEVLSLIFAGGLIWISALVQHVNNVRQRGPQFAMSDRSQPLSEDGLMGRATRALRNNMESVLMFAPVMLVAILTHTTSSATGVIAIVWMAARTLFTLAYWTKINLVRSLSWSTGMLAIAALVFFVLKAGVVVAG